MNKYAYIVDSSCFLEKKEAEESGYFYLPLRCSFDGEDYQEGVDLDKEKLKEAIAAKKNITTSQPTPGDVIELVNKLKEHGYEKAIFVCIGSGLSATGENVARIAEEEGFLIEVVDSYGVGPLQIIMLEKIKNAIENEDKSFEEAVTLIQPDLDNLLIYLMVDDLSHLSRGGRITPAAAAFGNMLKIKPLLSLEPSLKGGLDVIGKIRTTKKATKQMIKMAIDDKNLDDYQVYIGDFFGGELMEELRDNLLEIDPDMQILEFELTSVIGVHTGLKSVGIQLMKK